VGFVGNLFHAKLAARLRLRGGFVSPYGASPATKQSVALWVLTKQWLCWTNQADLIRSRKTQRVLLGAGVTTLNKSPQGFVCEVVLSAPMGLRPRAGVTALRKE